MVWPLELTGGVATQPGAPAGQQPQPLQDGAGAGAGGSGSGTGSGGGSGGAAAAGQTEGMRVFLSQIREWCVECSCDMLFISIRTDVAWYRLVKWVACMRALVGYMPWFFVCGLRTQVFKQVRG